MWWLSGIQRDVIMYSKPAPLHIIDYQVSTSLAPITEVTDARDGKRNASLVVSVGLDGLEDDVGMYEVVATLTGPRILEREPGVCVCVRARRVCACVHVCVRVCLTGA